MLVISSPSTCDGREGDAVGGFATAIPDDFDNIELLGGGPILEEDFHFAELFLVFNDKDVLPDLEVDSSEILADFSFDSEQEAATAATVEEARCASDGRGPTTVEERMEDEVMSATISKKQDSVVKISTLNSPASLEVDKEGRKHSKVSQARRKVKVDWTPELHRRFVQAVEQLGVDKAVPSRILELMGIDCLTRHNIASHLQKYRSHRKHLLAREAEAAGWRQRQQIYPSSGGAAAVGAGAKRDVNSSPWLAPTIGFPPAPPIQPFRPLHVWGHPPMDPTLAHMWPKHLIPTPSPPPLPPSWAPPLPPPHPSPWLPHYPRGPSAVTQGTPCYPRTLIPQMMGFPPPTVPGIPPYPLYRPDSAVHPNNKKLGSQLQLLDAHPSKESIDAAIGDALAKPWLPLPLGLKPPSSESVLVELQKQGISIIPPKIS